MATYLINNTTLESIANAIRNRLKSNNPIAVQDFASKINSIEQPVITPLAIFIKNKNGPMYLYAYSTATTITLLSTISTKEYTDFRGMFQGASNLTEIPMIDTSNATNMTSFCNGCTALKTVPALNVSKVTSFNNMFDGCTNLESIKMYGMKTSLDLIACTKLTREALLEVFNNLATVTTSTILRLHPNCVSKLTQEDKLIATNKGWTLQNW